MPLAINPNAICEIVLESDKDKEKQPRFLYRYLTGKQQIELTKMMDEIEGVKEGAEALEQIFRAASIGLTGWENITDENGEKIPFAKDRLKEVVGMMEAMELSHKVMAQRPTLDELKNSELQSQSSTEAAAKNVPE